MNEIFEQAWSVLLVAILGYLFGCINGSQIIGKIKGVDIKNSGVKNPGASNTTIVLGWKYGIIVAIIDILKAVIPVVGIGLVLQALGENGETITFLQYLTGAFAILGHNFPIQMKFLGGKGTASAVGMVLAVNWKFGLLIVAIFVLISFITNYIVLGVFSMYLSFLTTTFLFEASVIPTWIAIGLLLMAIIQHKENISRIRNKTETKLMSVVKKKAG